MPRLLALGLMMPLLTLYGDFMGMLGGFTVASGMLEVNPIICIENTRSSLTVQFFALEVFFRGYVFRVLTQRAGLVAGIAISSAMFSAVMPMW